MKEYKRLLFLFEKDTSKATLQNTQQTPERSGSQKNW